MSSDLTRAEIIAGLQYMLDHCPTPKEECPPMGPTKMPAVSVVGLVLTGRHVAVSRRYVRAIIKELQEAPHE